MFDGHGITTDDLGWIQRDQFVHYVELAHAMSEPPVWPRLRDDLLQALTAAFGLDDGKTGGGIPTPLQRRALQVLDDIRRHHDPATEWPAFFDALWSRRHAIRSDLA